MPKKQTWKILRWDGGRNDKWDPRDIADNEIAQGNNVDISQPGFIQTGGSFTAASSISNLVLSDSERYGNGLYAFAHDYEVAFTLTYDTGSAAISVGDTVTGASSGTTGVVINNVISSGSTGGGDAAGTLYLINVTASGESQPFTSNEDLNVGGAKKAEALAAGDTRYGEAPAVSTSPVVVMNDVEKVDLQDEATNLWYEDVLDLGSITGANAVEMNYYFYDGALRAADGNHANTSNIPQWFGHIKKDMMSGLLASDESASANKPKINSQKYNSFYFFLSRAFNSFLTFLSWAFLALCWN